MLICYCLIMNRNQINLAAVLALEILRIKERIRKMEAEIIHSLNGAHKVQSELASDLGISPQYLSDILRRRRGVSDEFLKAVIKVGKKPN